MFFQKPGPSERKLPHRCRVRRFRQAPRQSGTPGNPPFSSELETMPLGPSASSRPRNLGCTPRLSFVMLVFTSSGSCVRSICRNAVYVMRPSQRLRNPIRCIAKPHNTLSGIDPLRTYRQIQKKKNSPQYWMQVSPAPLLQTS